MHSHFSTLLRASFDGLEGESKINGHGNVKGGKTRKIQMICTKVKSKALKFSQTLKYIRKNFPCIHNVFI